MVAIMSDEGIPTNLLLIRVEFQTIESDNHRLNQITLYTKRWNLSRLYCILNWWKFDFSIS